MLFLSPNFYLYLERALCACYPYMLNSYSSFKTYFNSHHFWEALVSVSHMTVYLEG